MAGREPPDDVGLHVGRSSACPRVEFSLGRNVANGLVDAGDLGKLRTGQGVDQIGDPCGIGYKARRAVVNRVGDEDRAGFHPGLEPARDAEADHGADAGSDLLLDQAGEPPAVTASGQHRHTRSPGDPGLGRETRDREDPIAEVHIPTMTVRALPLFRLR